MCVMYNEKLINEVNKLGFRFKIVKISKDLGTSKGTVSSYLNGRIKASENFLRKFANFYDVDYDLVSDHCHSYTGHEIKKIRKQLSKNQSQFAEMLGVKLRTLQYWENGERNISQSAVLLLNRIVNDSESDSVPRIEKQKDNEPNAKIANPVHGNFALSPIDDSLGINEDDIESLEFHKRMHLFYVDSIKEYETLNIDLRKQLDESSATIVKLLNDKKKLQEELRKYKQDESIG